MEIINLTSKEFEKLKKFQVDKGTINCESQLFLSPQKSKWKTTVFLFKKFYETEGRYFSNKLYTINELINLKEQIDSSDFVMPEKLVAIDGVIVGYIMPLINGKNFETIFKSQDINITEKTKYLIEIGKILERLQKARTYKTTEDLYLNDVHEANFVFNKDTNKIQVVDMDSIRIGTNIPSCSKYLNPFSKVYDISKYKKHFNGDIYEVIPDENTEIYCYIIMIFNIYFGSNICSLPYDEFYYYLEYLSKIGVDLKLLEKLSRLYENKPNENPYKLLEGLIPFYGRTHKNTFEIARKRTFGLK